MPVSGYLTAAAERAGLSPESRPGDEVATVTAPDGTATLVPDDDARDTRLQTKYGTDAWITTDQLYNLEEAR